MYDRLLKSNAEVKTSVLLGANMPRKRVLHFVPRAILAKEMDKYLLNESKGTTVVLLGMGGSGKTQLALDCWQRVKTKSNFSAVIWIDASSPATVAQSYSNIALKVTGGSESIIDAEESMKIVERALQEQGGRWLVVLDNFDNPKAFQSHNIQHYIPTVQNGSTLFTSRHTDSERLGHVIRVSKMSEDESVNLLLHQSTSDAERLQGLKIAAMLGYLPLALDQAGAYIRARNLPLQDFESHYRKRKKRF